MAIDPWIIASNSITYPMILCHLKGTFKILLATTIWKTTKTNNSIPNHRWRGCPNIIGILICTSYKPNIISCYMDIIYHFLWLLKQILQRQILLNNYNVNGGSSLMNYPHCCLLHNLRQFLCNLSSRCYPYAPENSPADE